MDISVLSADQVGLELHRLIKNYDSYSWAVAWATEGPQADQLFAHVGRLDHLVIGTSFCITDPAFLRRLQDVSCARMANPDKHRLFHPKIYYFRSGSKAAAIVGSSNFTIGGTSSNIEMSILLEGDSDSAQLLEIRSRVIALWQQGEAIGQEFLDAYERQYLACQAAREVLSRPRKMRKPKRLAMNPGLLDYDWQTYSARLRGHGDERFDERLNVLQQAQNWFSRGQFFEDFLLEERRAISGVTGGIAKLPGRAGEVDWGIFGSMKGFGVLQSLILTNNHQLSVALDEIPTTGPVHRHQYDAYCDAMLLAFQGQYRVCGVSTVSRFLALKRPDTFVCVDDKNRSRIAKDLNFVASTQTIHSYWDDVIIPIMESRWWNSNRPTGTDGFLWDGRVAMLDSIYYDG